MTGILYGRSIARALTFLDHAETALVRVPISFDGRFLFLSINTKNVKAALEAYGLTTALPTKYDMNTRIVEIGSAEAITHAGDARE